MSNSVELAPLSHIDEANDIDSRESRVGEDFEGVDEGLIDREAENGNRRRIPFTPANEEGGGEYIPIPPVNHPPEGKPKKGRPFDVNLYATKKTVAQGMMDLALLTANANQLRYVLESGNYGWAYYLSIVLISLSIILQLMIGVALILMGRFDMRHEHHAHRSDRLNNYVILGVFLITSVNVFISAFGIDPIERIDPALIVQSTLSAMKQQSTTEFVELL